MKLILKFTKIYLNILSIISPKLSGKITFKLFQKIRLKKIKPMEESYYVEATHFTVPLQKEDLKCYEFGNKNGKLIFLVHGWESNAGCMTQFVKALIDLDYHIIGFDLPGHASHIESHTNLYESKEAFKELVDFINPTKPFSIISHSFGSVVTAFALENTRFKVDKMVFLSTTNNLVEIFNQFQKMVGFNNRVFNQFKKIIVKIMGLDVDEMVVSKRLKNQHFNQLLIIHDKFDKVIPFSNAKEITDVIPNSTLIPFEKIGHYRMLWNDEVVNETIQFITSKEQVLEEPISKVVSSQL